MQILLANPRGFCAGVDRAIAIVNRALELFGAPIYVRHEVVHNKFVVDDLRARGAIFVEHVADVPNNAILIFSAHGVSKRVQNEANSRNLKIFDATCPLVTKVHLEVAKYSQKGTECILIGHAKHPEVEGTIGQYDCQNQGGIYLVEKISDITRLQIKNPDNLAFVTQTTLSLDDALEIITALKQRFPKIKSPRKDDICYATQNRQEAVKKLAKQCDLVLIVGSPNSSNSNRLCELAQKIGTTAYLIDSACDLDPNWLENVQTIGISAGASAPDILVQEVINALHDLAACEVTELTGKIENLTFTIPQELRIKKCYIKQ